MKTMLEIETISERFCVQLWHVFYGAHLFVFMSCHVEVIPFGEICNWQYNDATYIL